jgi:hypothetical protein
VNHVKVCEPTGGRYKIFVLWAILALQNKFGMAKRGKIASLCFTMFTLTRQLMLFLDKRTENVNFVKLCEVGEIKGFILPCINIEGAM